MDTPDNTSPEVTARREATLARGKKFRGFAAMDPSKQREIAAKGGKSAHAKGVGHEWNVEAAREAGRKGGKASRGGRGKLTTVTEMAAALHAEPPRDPT